MLGRGVSRHYDDGSPTQFRGFQAMSADIEKLKEFIRANTRDHLKNLSRASSVAIKEIEENREVLAHWTSLILVSGERIRVTFRAHFATLDAKAMASKAYMTDSASVPAEMAHDFMKEFCNVCAGRMKRLFLQNEVDVGISLPFITRGFDQIFDQPSKDSFSWEDKWHLACDGSTIDCSVRIEAAAPVTLADYSSSEAIEGKVDVL
jgi:CheY-specific phosphatase CheX